MKRAVFIIFSVIIIQMPVMACYGGYCSTELGTIYDYPWKVINQVTKPYPTSVISVLDGAYNLEDIPPVTQHNPNYNYSYQLCQGNNNCQPTNKQVIFP